MSSSTGTVVFNDSRIKATGVIATESIGVGTANPTSNLHVVGNASIQSNLEVGTANLFVDTTTGRVGVGTANPTSNLHVVGDASIRSNLEVGTANLFVDTTTGRVGVGTTNPIAQLDINGGAENNTTPALSIRGGLYNPSDLYVLNTYNVNTGVGYAAKVIGVNIKNKVETDNTVQLRNNIGGVTSAGAIYLGTDDVNQGIFGVLGASGVAGTTLSEHLTVRAGGNVGIGTTNPSYNLHVNGKTRLYQFAGSRSGTFSGSGTFYLPGDLNYGNTDAPIIGWEIHMVFGFTGTNFGTFYISGCQDTSSSVVGASEPSSFRIYDNTYGAHSGTAYLTANRETVAPVYYAKITLAQPYYNNVSTSTNGTVSRHHFMFECVGCHAGVGSTKYQGSGFFQFATSARRPKYIRLTSSTGSVQGNYMINPLTA
jgi:hypothetical protein